MARIFCLRALTAFLLRAHSGRSGVSRAPVQRAVSTHCARDSETTEAAAEAYRVPAEFSRFPAPPENVRRAVGWVYDEL